MLSTLALAAPVIHHWGPPFGIFPFFFLIPLFWIVVVIVLVAVFGGRRRRMWARYGGHPGFGPGAWGAARGAESTLAERFANGDIDEKEYRARLEVLRVNSGYPQGK